MLISKIMVFNAVKYTQPFIYNDSKLDKVDSSKYLGMTINRSGFFYSTGTKSKSIIRV